MRRARLRDQVIEQLACPFGRGRGAETRAGSRACVRGQGELRHQQHPAAHRPHVPVHAAFVIGKNTITEQPLEQTIGVGLGILPLHADEREHTAADGASDAVPHPHFGLRDTLNQCDHSAKDPRNRGVVPQ